MKNIVGKNVKGGKFSIRIDFPDPVIRSVDDIPII